MIVIALAKDWVVISAQIKELSAIKLQLHIMQSKKLLYKKWLQAYSQWSNHNMYNHEWLKFHEKSNVTF